MVKHESALADTSYQDALAVLERLARVNPRPPTPPPSEEPMALPDAPVQTWSEHSLRDLLETLPDAVAVIGSHGTIVLVNAQTERVFGYKREEMLGRPIEMLIPERFRRGHVGYRDGYFAAPRSRPMGARLELFGRRKDGSEFPVEISLSPLKTEQGTYATSVIRDISQRKREEAKFKTLVENIPAVTFIAPLDDSAPELYVSPEIERMLGFSQKEWLEDPVLWHRQLHPDDRERWNRQFAPTCASGQPFKEIYRFKSKKGKDVWVLGSASVVRDADGQPSFLQGVAFDITSIKEAEAALRAAQEELLQSYAELDRRVVERTKELTRSLAELQVKTDELKQFAYFASHELKEPLRSLVNYPQMLAKNYGDKFDEKAEGWVNKTIDGATRMRRLIDDISSYSRYLQKDQQKFEPIDCITAAGEACQNLQAAIEESGAEVLLGELPTVLGNRYHLMVLYQNLIGNAIKYRAADRTPRIEIDAKPHEEGWLFRVSDNGMGIEDKYFAKIFVLGERLHSASQIPGTGFGLSICEKIVARHGGRIWVKSQPGQGSVFYFTLPALA